MTDEQKKLVEDAYSQASAMFDTSDKPTYAGTYDQQIKDTYDKIANREAFSYDLNGDALYKQYKDNYVQAGKQSMKDTMGQAAALTGGYGSSYSQAAGQQAYDQQLRNLSDMIPELYNMAYNRYQDEGTALQNQYSMLGDLQNTEYSRYQDALNNYNNDAQTRYSLWQDAYERMMNEENTAYNRQQDEYNKQQTAYSNLYSLIGSTGYSPSDDELTAAGMSRAQANALVAAYQAAQASKTTSSSSGSSGGSGSGSKAASSSTASSPKYTYGDVMRAAGSGGSQVVQAAVADGSITAAQGRAIIDYWNRQ